MSNPFVLLLLALTPPFVSEPARAPHASSGRAPILAPTSPTGGGSIAATTDDWTPISSLPITLSTSGGYYLTGNLTGPSGAHGIIVAANDVVIDLNGFVLAGAPGSLDGIRSNGGLFRIEVRNGAIRSWGQDGIDLGTTTQCLTENVRTKANGGMGVCLGSESRVANCQASQNGAEGFSLGFDSVAEGSLASENKQEGFFLVERGRVVGCLAIRNEADGIFGNEILVRECEAALNSGHGIVVNSSSQVSACSSTRNVGDGIRLGSNCVARENHATLNGAGSGSGAGIRAAGSGSRIEGNHVMTNDRGIELSSGSNLVIRNSAAGNVTNYVTPVGNTVGPIVTSGTIAASSNPHANYSQ